MRKLRRSGAPGFHPKLAAFSRDVWALGPRLCEGGLSITKRTEGAGCEILAGESAKTGAVWACSSGLDVKVSERSVEKPLAAQMAQVQPQARYPQRGGPASRLYQKHQCVQGSVCLSISQSSYFFLAQVDRRPRGEGRGRAFLSF